MKKKWFAIGWVAIYIIIAFSAQFVLMFQLMGAMYGMLIKNGMIQNVDMVESILMKLYEMVQKGSTLILLSFWADFIMFACFATWYYLRERKYPFRPNYKKAFTVKNVLSIVGLGFFGQYAVEWIVIAIRVVFPNVYSAYEEFSKTFDLSTASPVFMIFVVCLFGPLVEEVLFRGMIYGKLRHNGFSILVAALISSAVFGAFHMNWVQGAYAFAFGMALAYIYEKTQTIWGSVLLHVVFNSSSYLIEYLQEWLLQYERFSMDVFMLLFRVVSVGIVILLLRQFRTRKQMLSSPEDSDIVSQNKEANPLLVQRDSDFASQNKEANPLLVQRDSDFASQNKED